MYLVREPTLGSTSGTACFSTSYRVKGSSRKGYEFRLNERNRKNRNAEKARAREGLCPTVSSEGGSDEVNIPPNVEFAKYNFQVVINLVRISAVYR